jgi:hypothetical protein
LYRHVVENVPGGIDLLKYGRQNKNSIVANRFQLVQKQHPILKHIKHQFLVSRHTPTWNAVDHSVNTRRKTATYTYISHMTGIN